MWIFSSGAFVSVVADRDNTKNLLVRARVDGHIEHLFPKVKVFQIEGSDYLYRSLVSRKAVAEMVAKQVGSIEYDNFKNSVPDPAYHAACLLVWSDMNRLQGRGRGVSQDWWQEVT